MTSEQIMMESSIRLLGDGAGLNRVGRRLRGLDSSSERSEVCMGHCFASRQSLSVIITKKIVQEVKSLGSHQMLNIYILFSPRD